MTKSAVTRYNSSGEEAHDGVCVMHEDYAKLAEELDRLRAEREGRVQMMRRLHDQIGMMIDQVGQPDYSLRELVNEMRGIRDVLLAAAKKGGRDAA